MAPQHEKEMRLAFVGSVVPERPEYFEGNYSHAANMWQINVINALAKSHLPPTIILSQRQTRGYQHSGTLLVPAESDTLSNGMNVKLAPFLNLPILRQLSVGIAVVFYLLRWATAREQRGKCKAIFSYNLLEPPGIFTWIAGRLIGATTVCCINDINIIGETLPDTLVNRLAIRLVERTIGLFDGIIVITDDIAKDFVPGHNYLRVPGAVDSAIIDRFEHVRGIAHARSEFNIVSTGNLSHINGFEEIINGFLLTTNPSYRLRIAGVGVLKTKLEQAAALDDRIEYLGQISFDDVLNLYETADCIVNMRLTKRYNTKYFFPSKLFEFLGSGVPVITTCPGHVAAEYGDIAVLLHEETPEALASAIDYLANLPSEVREKIGEAAAQHMRLHYTWDTMGHRIVEYIRAIASNRSPQWVK